MFVPLVLIVATLLLMVGFQSVQLMREHDLLETRIANQAGPLEEAKKIRMQLDSIAKSTAQLAAQGNANAQRMVEELKRNGITINPNAAPAIPSASSDR